MLTDAPRTAQHQWCDVESVHISLCWVTRVAEHPKHGALRSGLHQRDQAVGRGPHQLYVRVKGVDQPVSVSPQLLRLLPDAPGGG